MNHGTTGPSQSTGSARLRTAIAAIGTFAVLAAGCATTDAVETTVDDGCDDAIVIAARGSGQPPGVGEQNQAVIDKLAAAQMWDAFTVDAVPYPAPSVQDDPTAWFEGRYDESVDAGVVSTAAAVRRWTTTCADADIVLLGYSQGAQVVESTVEGLEPGASERISAVVVMASPRHDPGRAESTHVGGTITTDGGLLGPWQPPTWLGERLISVCDPGDLICSGALGFSHASAYLDADLAAEVAAAVAATVGS